MGPIAGIGDSLVVGTVIPILLGIAMGMSGGGSPMGAIFYIIVWNLFAYFGMRFLYFKGYDMGTKAVEFLVGDIGTAIREAVTTLGGIVIGAVSATWVSVKTSFALYNEAGEAYMVLQEKLDSVFPGLLTAVFVIFCWWLMAKKRFSPLKTSGSHRVRRCSDRILQPRSVLLIILIRKTPETEKREGGFIKESPFYVN